MPQWRKLHVKATESLDVNDMPDDFTRLLWVMLPLGLDREGRGLDNPAWVKAKIMPLRTDVTPLMVEEAMTWFAGRGMIERYEVRGRRYFWLTSFARYQGKTDREAPSEYPPPPECGATEVESKSGIGQELVVSESSTDSDVDTESESESDSGAKAPQKDDDEKPLSLKLTPSRRILKAKLDACVFKPQNRRGPIKFPSTKTADKFDKAAERLNSNLVAAIDTALEQGCTNVVRVVNYIAKWQPNGGKHAAHQQERSGNRVPGDTLSDEQRRLLEGYRRTDAPP
jgi:hypothetical protein